MPACVDVVSSFRINPCNRVFPEAVKGVRNMRNLITSIIDRFKKMMENYENLYREAYRDPNFRMIERYTISGVGYY